MPKLEKLFTFKLPAVMFPDTANDCGKLIVIVPVVDIGLPETLNVLLFTPTYVTVPAPDSADSVTRPVPFPVICMPVPAAIEVTPVLMTVN